MRTRLVCIAYLSRLSVLGISTHKASVAEDEHDLKDGCIRSASLNVRVIDDLVKGHVSISQRCLDDLLNTAEHSLEAGAACSRKHAIKKQTGYAMNAVHSRATMPGLETL